MKIRVDDQELETTENGYLVNQRDWSARAAEAMAAQEDIELSARHWDIINFLRDCYFNHGGELPNNRAIVKGMQAVWTDQVVDSRMLFELFPGNPSKQAGRIAGLPESLRKGGY